MKEMETAEVQETCEDNKEVAKEIKVLCLTWEELLLAEKHMESAVVEDLSSDKVKSTRLTLTPECGRRRLCYSGLQGDTQPLVSESFLDYVINH